MDKWITVRFRTLLATVAILCVAACSSSPSPDDRTATQGQELTTGVQACPPGPSYTVLEFAPPGVAPSCPDVPGKGGTWTYSGPPSVTNCTATADPGRGDPFLCVYSWNADPSSGGAPPDVAALDGLPDAYVAQTGSGGGDTCSTPSFLPYVAMLDEAGVTCPVPPGHDQPTQCEVCGRALWPGVWGYNLWLPGDNQLHTLSIGMSNGTRQVMTIGPTGAMRAARSGSRNRHALVVIPLPDPPDGVYYVDGPALGYGYGKSP